MNTEDTAPPPPRGMWAMTIDRLLSVWGYPQGTGSTRGGSNLDGAPSRWLLEVLCSKSYLSCLQEQTGGNATGEPWTQPGV